MAEAMATSICERFKIKTLTANQEKTITALENGKDVFTSTKTGSGKSMCYEYFPVMHPGSCVLIIAPLISIMKEQCVKLLGLGFKATYIGKDVQETDSLLQGSFDFIFGSPEVFINNSKWRTMLKSDIYQRKLQLLAVDEAHTVTQWYVYIYMVLQYVQAGLFPNSQETVLKHKEKYIFQYCIMQKMCPYDGM
jgi:ATP-dependent DNA helicase RecQ